jgi:hypothetical protein
MVTRRFIAFLVAGVVILAGCGDGSSGDIGDQTTTSTATTSEAPTTTSVAPTTTTTIDAEEPSAEELNVVGVVIAVDGDLDAVASFTLRLDDGSDLAFTPDEHAQFDGGPIGHIREHLTSGAPVSVDYVVLDDGTNLALDIGDA